MISAQAVMRAAHGEAFGCRWVSAPLLAKLRRGQAEVRDVGHPVWILELQHSVLSWAPCDQPAPDRDRALEIYLPAVARPSWDAERFVLEKPPADLLCPCCHLVLQPVDIPRLVTGRECLHDIRHRVD